MPAEPTAIMREGLLPRKNCRRRAMLRTGVGFDRLMGFERQREFMRVGGNT